MRVDVRGTVARLFINHAQHPVLVVSDMKLGDKHRGGVGRWIEAGTIGFFSGLQISQAR